MSSSVLDPPKGALAPAPVVEGLVVTVVVVVVLADVEVAEGGSLPADP